jgi:hypothetical protein
VKKIIVSFSFLFLLFSCSGSKKGAWSKEDKIKAKSHIQESGVALEFLGPNKQQFMDCYLDKIEKKYDNFNESLSDTKGSDEIAASCLEEIIF